MYNFLKIGPMTLSISMDEKLPWSEEVQIFQIFKPNFTQHDIEYKITFVDTFEPLWGTIQYSNETMMVIKSDEKEYRIYMLPQTGEPFALVTQKDEHTISILIDKKISSFLKWNRSFVGLFALEHICLQFNAFLLHASYIIYKNQAIIFTGPSGIGKSTQAQLWADYENAEIVNGDRTLLMCKDGKWFASGFPVCGSSPYCKNKTTPIKAILCLEQGDRNSIEKLTSFQTIKRIYSQTFVNRWNSKDCDTVVSLITTLSENVPIYHYKCTKDNDAVTKLKHVLQLR